MEEAIRKILKEIDPDPTRPELMKTPQRIAESLRDLTRGNRESLEEILGDSTFEDPSKTMVLVKDISFFSLCEHHLLPFFGKVHAAYVPDGQIIGLSKIPRVVEHFSRRLQVQERLTDQVASALEDVIRPRGLGVVIEATHLCMVMRGVQKVGSVAVTSCLKGSFLQDARTRSEFLSLIHGVDPESSS